MTTSTTPTTSRHPWWIVNTIFDLEGLGGDFSYTEGLAARGLPEIHIWARPDQGADPGADWKFSPRDTWEQSYDEGLVTAR